MVYFIYRSKVKTGGNAMYTILVCDDERDIVSAIKIYLEAEGYRVVCAYDGREALEILRQ